jgi:hypothetical protein
MINPKLPGTNHNDPKVLASAKRVATRRNNKARKKLAAERAALPLLAEQIPDEPEHLMAPEEVIERRQINQQSSYERSVERELKEIENIRRYRNEVFALVSESEYAEFYAGSLETTIPRWAYWYNIKADIERRREPMPTTCELVLTWLVDWEGPAPTIGELHQLRGDGLSRAEISEALDWLERRRYIRGGIVRPCRFVTNPWTNTSTPFEVTEAGVNLINADS